MYLYDVDASALSQKTLLARALDIVDGNQAELARRLGRSGTTVNRWVNGQNGIDYESALRLARMTGLPPAVVISAVGLDAALLPPPPEPRDLTPIQKDVLQRMARVQSLVDAAEGLPDDFVPVYVAKILDRTEVEIEDTIKMVMQVRAALRRRSNNASRRILDNAKPDADNEGDSGFGHGITSCQHAVNAHLTLPITRLVATS